jgi:hypothetical protein
MRYFRVANAAIYEAVRAELDAAYGYPSEDGQTVTAITPAADAPVDNAGRVYLLASESECEYPAVAERLPGLLASDTVEEVTAADWDALFPLPV